MASFESLQEFNKKNLYEINYKKLHKQVKAAMKKKGEARDSALKNIVKDRFPKFAKEYEAVRQKFKADFANSDSMGNDYFTKMDQRQKMSKPPEFLEGFTNIINEMAKESDPSHEAKFYAGLSKNEAFELVNGQFDSFTKRDWRRYTLMNSWGIDSCVKDINGARYTHNGQIYQYRTDKNADKEAIHMNGGIQEAYMTKLILQDELKAKGFFWRLFHRKEVNRMRNVINLVDGLIKDTGFPGGEEAEKVISEYQKTSCWGEEVKQALDYVDKKFKSQEVQLDTQTEKLNAQEAVSDEKEKITVELNDGVKNIAKVEMKKEEHTLSKSEISITQ